MRLDMLPGTTNVVRFPVERRVRPTLALLHEIVPDVREVLAIAEAFDLAMPPHDLRDHVDAATAEHLLNQAPADGPERDAMLVRVAGSALTTAIAACQLAADKAASACEARRGVREAEAQAGYWLDQLVERANARAVSQAEALVLAHARTEEAFGVVRAVELARARQAWFKRSYREVEAAVFGVRRAG